MRGRLLPLHDDWYEWVQEPEIAAPIHVEIAADHDGRLVVMGLHVLGRPSSELLRSIHLGRIEAAANAQLTPSAGGGDEDAVDQAAEERSRRRPARLPAHQVSATRRPDAFYAAVSRAYQDLASTSRRPAAELADINGVPPSTAHRWVKEARRRGLLAPGRPGKAG